MTTMQPQHFFRLFCKRTGWVLLFIGIGGCGSSGGGGASVEDWVVSSDQAEDLWPNESTTDQASSQITSKILITDLNQDEVDESIFISVLPNSSNPRSSMLRITSGEDFTEVANFKSSRLVFLQDATPFALDLNKDGTKELLFVSFDRDQIFALDFHPRKKRKVKVRWRVSLPKVLAPDFDRRLQVVDFDDQTFVKVGPYGLREKSRRRIKIIDLRTGKPTNDDDDDEEEEEDE
jgi:hypothetical protein